MSANTPYIVSLNNYTERRYSSFPYMGWMKPCFRKDCRQITSRNQTISYKKYILKYIYAKTVYHTFANMTF